MIYSSILEFSVNLYSSKKEMITISFQYGEDAFPRKKTLGELKNKILEKLDLLDDKSINVTFNPHTLKHVFFPDDFDNLSMWGSFGAIKECGTLAYVLQGTFNIKTALSIDDIRQIKINFNEHRKFGIAMCYFVDDLSVAQQMKKTLNHPSYIIDIERLTIEYVNSSIRDALKLGVSQDVLNGVIGKVKDAVPEYKLCGISVDAHDVLVDLIRYAWEKMPVVYPMRKDVFFAFGNSGPLIVEHSPEVPHIEL